MMALWHFRFMFSISVCTASGKSIAQIFAFNYSTHTHTQTDTAAAKMDSSMGGMGGWTSSTQRDVRKCLQNALTISSKRVKGKLKNSYFSFDCNDKCSQWKKRKEWERERGSSIILICEQKFHSTDKDNRATEFSGKLLRNWNEAINNLSKCFPTYLMHIYHK